MSVTLAPLLSGHGPCTHVTRGVRRGSSGGSCSDSACWHDVAQQHHSLASPYKSWKCVGRGRAKKVAVGVSHTTLRSSQSRKPTPVAKRRRLVRRARWKRWASFRGHRGYRRSIRTVLRPRVQLPSHYVAGGRKGSTGRSRRPETQWGPPAAGL